MKRRKVLCPGCGGKMECNEPHPYVYGTPDNAYWICGYRCNTLGCGWGAPIGRGNTEEEALQNAYEKAVRRVGDDCENAR